MPDDWREINRAWWDERVPLHTGSAFYDVDGFLTDPGVVTLRPFEIDEMGDVRGRSLVHLQCHFGLDTLSWARRGATVTGLDFSTPAVAAATGLAERARLEAEFVAGDVYDAVELLGGRTFDIVYTGLGALCWLPDIDLWAAVAAALVAPGGVLYLAEFHPFTWVFGDDDLTVEHPYFHEGPLRSDEPGSYTDFAAETVSNQQVLWNHGLGELVTAIAAAGLAIEHLHEHDYTLFARWPMLMPDSGAPGIYRMPEGMPSLPLVYSLMARGPA